MNALLDHGSDNRAMAWAMPSARAATPSGLSRLRRLRARIASLSRIDNTADADGDGAQLSTPACLAIAAFNAIYFGLQLLRGVL